MEIPRINRDSAVSKLSNSGALGRALAYLDKYWSRLSRYTERGDLPIDNNPCHAANGITPAKAPFAPS